MRPRTRGQLLVALAFVSLASLLILECCVRSGVDTKQVDKQQQQQQQTTRKSSNNNNKNNQASEISVQSNSNSNRKKSESKTSESQKTNKLNKQQQRELTVSKKHQVDQSEDDNDDDDDEAENELDESGAGNSRRLQEWLRESRSSSGRETIELVDSELVELLMDELKYLVVLYYEPSQCVEAQQNKRGSASTSNNKCKKILQELENIDDETDDLGVQFVKCEDTSYAKSSLGISSFPALVYYEQTSSMPSIYVGDLEQEELVLEWLIKQKNEDTIESINRDILAHMISEQKDEVEEDNDQDADDDDDDDQANDKKNKKKNKSKQLRKNDYVAVLFYKSSDKESDRVLEQLESIDDDLAEYEIQLVKLADDLMAKKYGVKPTPGLVLFRRGEPLKYTGSLQDTNELLSWLTKPENLETKDSIESVNEKLFHRFVKETKHLAVLFHSESGSCKQCERVMKELETIDDELSELGIRFIKVDSMKLARQFGVHALPSLVFLSGADDPKQAPEATIYAGSLRKAHDILEWLSERKSPDLHVIQELAGRQLREAIKKHEHLAVYLYAEDTDKSKDDNDDDDDDDDDDEGQGSRPDDDDDGEEGDDQDEEDDVLAGLENIDSECRKQQIEFFKSKDKQIIRELGLDEGEDLPALIYFEHGQPSIFEGDLSAEEDLLDWLLKQKHEDTIEEVNRRLLERLIESSHYLVVLFYKNNCKSCQAVLETLEKIDDDCDTYGMNMVKINDQHLAKRYGIKTFPALVYFRNGNPLVYNGDLKNEHQVLEWLLEDEQRELNDEIEDINGKMLDKLIDSSPFLAALFYDDDCTICNKVLHELEKIDDDTDTYGIDFVKINDFQAARKYNVHNFPTLVYFRKQTPSYYDGDLLDEEKVLNWLTSEDVFELEDEIEEVNKKMLDKLLETSDYIAVLFYEKNCKHCDEVLKELEHIDDEADSLDIMFVKIRDMNYAKKFGITQAPSLVYFRKKFPSIYRGDLMKEEKVLEWLRKNRYRNPELNLFMYALFTMSISFIIYTIFLIFCVKKKQD